MDEMDIDEVGSEGLEAEDGREGEQLVGLRWVGRVGVVRGVKLERAEGRREQVFSTSISS